MSDFAFDVTSSAFSEGSPIPARYTCDGEDVSLPLEWSTPPEGTRSIALIADDPDAPGRTWVHWVLYAIPIDLTGLAENVPGGDVLPSGARHGKNSSNRREYSGPCPPGGTHRYFFKVYALDSEVDLRPGATKEELLKAMEGSILAGGELMGTYQRR